MKATKLDRPITRLPIDRPRVGDGLAVDAPALMLHDCLRQYEHVRKTYGWNRRKHEAAVMAYNESLKRFEAALERKIAGGTESEVVHLRRAA